MYLNGCSAFLQMKAEFSDTLQIFVKVCKLQIRSYCKILTSYRHNTLQLLYFRTNSCKILDFKEINKEKKPE